MNIKINIKDCDCTPAIITKNQLSEVQFKKKNMLYAPPTKDKKYKPTTATVRKQEPSTRYQNTQNYQQSPTHINYSQNPRYQETQKRMIQQLSQIGKNQATLDMVHNSNTILQRQNQILESNQRTLHNMVNTNGGNVIQNSRINEVFFNQQKSRQMEFKKMFQEATNKMTKEIYQMKKIRDEIVPVVQQFKRTMSDGRSLNNTQKSPQQIGQMNNNLKNLVQISKNQLQGLQNMQGIKSLQNFNIQAYSQAVNSLKKQIVQYQKQSQTIQRELKIRAAKLQKMDVSPNFNQELLKPYEQHLKKKIENIDMHAIREKVYEKLGVFDYGKFEFDVCGIMNQSKNQMNQIGIVCKQYRIDVPDIKIDKKQLKQLDLKLPSILDEYKASKGINLKPADPQDKFQIKKPSTSLKQTREDIPMAPRQHNLKKTKPVPKSIQQLNSQSKPVDHSTNVKFTRPDQQKFKSVLQTKMQKQRKSVQKNTKINKDSKEQDEFQKYLQNRARQELQILYKERKEKLQKMQKELHNQIIDQEPRRHLNLNVRNQVSPKKQEPKKIISQNIHQEYEQYQDDFDQQQKKPQQKENIKRQEGHKKSAQQQKITQIGTEVLKQKLKNLFSNQPPRQNIHMQQNLNQNYSQQIGVGSLAQNFIGVINNTLTQINNQLSNSIQKKVDQRSLSRERPGVNVERRSPNRINVPKLQEFRAPPVFNMQIVQGQNQNLSNNNNNYNPNNNFNRRPQQVKIVPKNYDHLKVQDDDDDLEVSALSYE